MPFVRPRRLSTYLRTSGIGSLIKAWLFLFFLNLLAACNGLIQVKITNDGNYVFEGVKSLRARPSDGTWILRWDAIPYDGVSYEVFQREVAPSGTAAAVKQSDYDFSSPKAVMTQDYYISENLTLKNNTCFMVKVKYPDYIDTNQKELCTGHTAAVGVFVKSTPPVFVSLNLSNAAMDKILNAAERSLDSEIILLKASDYTSSKFAFVGGLSTLNDCSALPANSFTEGLPKANDPRLATDGSFKVCVELTNATATKVYGISSDALLVDTVAPVGVSLALANAAADGIVNASEGAATTTVVSFSGTGSTVQKYAVVTSSVTSCDASQAYYSELPTSATLATSDGIQKICVRAEDAAGNLSFAISPQIVVDKTPPSVSISAPSLASIVVSQTTTFTLTFSDAVSGVKNISLDNNNLSTYLTLSGATIGCSATVSGNGNATRTVSITGCSASTGSVTMSLAANSATDAAGNSAAAAGPSAAFSVGNSLPTLTSLNFIGAAADGYLNATEKSANTNLAALNASGYSASSYAIVAAGITCDAAATYPLATVPTSGNAGFTDGNKQLCVKLTNSAGATAYGASSTLIVDTSVPVAPNVIIDSGTDEFLNASESTTIVTITGELNTIYTLTCVSNCTIISGASGSLGTSGSAIAVIQSTEGTVNVSVTLRDAAGNQSTAGSDTATADLTPPTFTSLTLQSPVADGFLNAADAGLTTAIASLSASGQDTALYALVATNITCNGSVTYNKANIPAANDADLAEGNSYKLCVKLADTAGNLTYGSAASNFTVDKTSPAISISAPSVPTITSSQTTTYTLTYSDAGSGVNNIILNDTNKATYITLSGATAGCSATVSGTGNSTRTVSITGCTATTGAVTLSIGANSGTDAAGNSATAAGPSASFTVSNSLPSFTSLDFIGAAADGFLNATEKTADSVTAALNASGYSSANYAIVSTGTTCNAAVTYALATLPKSGNVGFTDGNKQVCVKLTNSAGAAVYGVSGTLVVDTSAPSAPTVTTDSGGDDNLNASENPAMVNIVGEVNAIYTLTCAASCTIFSGASGNLGASGTATAVIQASAGTVSVSATLRDAAGNQSTAGSDTATADFTAPTFTSLTLQSPVSDGFLNATDAELSTALATLSASGHDSAAYALVAPNITCNSSVTYNKASVPIANDTDFTEGNSYKLCVKLADTAGNITYGSAASNFTVDKIKPAMSISAPNVSAVTLSQTVTYTLTYTDAGSGVNNIILNDTNKAIYITLSGATAGCSATVSGTGNSTRTVSITGCSSASGSVSISISADTATDAAGNSGAAAGPSAAFTVKNAPPNLTITSPVPNTPFQSSFTVQGSCESGSTVTASVVDGGSSAATTCAAGNTYSINLSLEGTDGNRTVVVSSIDVVQQTTLKAVIVKRDATPPELNITSPAADMFLSSASVSTPLQGTCETGLTVTLSGDVTAGQTTPCPSGTFSFASWTVTSSTGSKFVSVSQTDAVGLVGTSPSRRFNLNSAPTDISLSANSIYENNAVNAVVGTLNATDPDAGDTPTFTLVAACSGNNSGNSAFNINGNSLRASNALNFDAQSFYTICVRVTDSGSASFDKSFRIDVMKIISFAGATGTIGLVGTAMSVAPTMLNNQGAAVTSCTSSPALPAGLSINATSCVISGTPSAAASATYTITATNSVGFSNATVALTIEVISPATTNSNTFRDGTKRHSFFDTINSIHWRFYVDGSAIKIERSANGTTWYLNSSVAVSVTDFNLHFKAIGGTGYVFLASTEGYDIVLRRGSLTASGISWNSPITVFDGSSANDLYINPSLVTSDTYLWVGAARDSGSVTWDTRVRRSTNAANDDLTLWQSATTLGAASASPRSISLLPKTGEDIYALYQDGTAVVGYTYSAGTWSLASGGGELGWLTLPGTNGLNNTVDALVVSGSDLYAGGSFTTLGGVSANRIAKWNGSSWSSLGSGMNGNVKALAVSGSDLYVGGGFTTAGGVSANRIAKWNGSSWSALGSGTNGNVLALAVSSTDLYAGGAFTTAGGVSVNYIAKWNGTSWSALGSGMGSNVEALALNGTELYAGGQFTTAGGGSANRIAKWNGTSWSALGSGMNSGVSALAAIGTDLYAGGSFTTAGGVSANYIAKWNGSSWSALGSGLSEAVYSLAVSGSDLYVGGTFTTAGGLTSYSIAKWSGSSWSAVNSVMDLYISALAVSGSDLYAGGNFSTVGGNANRIAKWNGSSWSALVSGMDSSVTALAVSGTNLYAAGYFTTVGGVTANRIAKWDGSSWSALGSGMNSAVLALAVNGSDLYAGGSFTNAGGVSANYIAKWNGSSWSALGTGMNSTVTAFAMSGTDLYAGGTFGTAGGVSASNIAKWNGSTWSALGAGVDNSVNALALSGSNLYAGGFFTTAGGVSAIRIAKWDGTSWSALGSGMDNIVYALAVSGTDLYAGGSFTTAGGVSANRIAKWNGSAWSALGSGVNGLVKAIAIVSGSEVLVGGSFTTAGGASANYIAKWSGSAWSALGSGMNNIVNAVDVASGGQIYAGADSSIRMMSNSALNATSYSAVTNVNADPVVAYTDENGLVKVKTYSSGNWSAATTLQSSGVSFAPIVSSVPDTNKLYAMWFRDGALEYKYFDGATWDTNPTTLVSSASAARFAGCDFTSGGGIIKCMMLAGSSAPYSILSALISSP